jgi:SAM-dependent methyltransferase
MFNQPDSYQQFMGRWSQRLASELVRFAAIKDGDYVLDVGSGTGALARAIRDAYAHVRVEGIDPSEAFVRYATEKVGRSDGRVRFAVGDAQQLGFADGTFDAVLSSLVLNFVPDPSRALREISRVAKPGSVFAASLWDLSEHGMMMLRVFWEEAVELDPAAKSFDETSMPLCQEGALAKLCAQQGFDDVQSSSITVPLRFASLDDFWKPFLFGIGPAGTYATALTPERQNTLRDRFAQRLLEGGVDGPIEMNARAWVVRATTPA